MNTLKVKCYLFPDNAKIHNKSIEKITEIRRFNLTTAAGGAQALYNQLVEKIASSFGQLVTAQDELRTYWLDEENELIGFNSGDDLNYAIEILTSRDKPYDAQFGLTFKVFVAKVAKQTSSDEETSPTFHFGVTCDGCDGSIFGIRYKCKICPDFDLCSSCKAKSLHKEHEFLEINKPTRTCPRMRPVYPFPFDAASAYHPRCRPHPHHRHPHHHHKSHDKPQPENQPKQPDEPSQQQQQQQQQHQAHNFAYQTITDFLPHLTANVSHVAEQEHLKNIGEHVKNLLHPFGIDVSYYMGSNFKPTAASTQQQAQQSAQTSSTTTTAQSTMETNEPAQETEPLLVPPSDNTAPASAPPADVNVGKNNISPYDAAANALNKMVMSDNAVANTSTSITAANDVEEFNLIEVDNEMAIINAIEHLRAMGYGDDGGWLTRLVSSKRGDINAVLDALKPTVNFK